MCLHTHKTRFTVSPFFEFEDARGIKQERRTDKVKVRKKEHQRKQTRDLNLNDDSCIKKIVRARH